MFSSRITNSGRFIKMPPSSQSLYFHLGIHADDDGIVEAYQVMKLTGANDDDLKVLVSKNFIKVLNEDLVSFITDWREHNLIRADRKIDSIYKNLLLQIVPETELLQPKPRADTGKIATGRPVDYQRTAQDKISKDKLYILSKDNTASLKKTYGNTDINELTTFLKETLGLKLLDGSQQANRRFCHLAIKKFGKDVLKDIIQTAAENDFWKNKITDFKGLYYSGVKIAATLKDKKKWNVI